MASLQDYSLAQLTELVTSYGFPAYRGKQLYEASSRYKTYAEATNLPSALKEKLQQEGIADTALEIVKKLESKRDGTQKYLFRFRDGELAEGVFLPHGYGNSLCVSTQIGCRMGCKFCASGLDGLKRNLTAGEMLAQVLAVNRLNGGTPEKRAVTNVVMMGSGEPLDNYDESVRFLQLLSAQEGIGISPRNVSLSTCGLVDKIDALADTGLPVTLSISLHAPTDESRSALMPVNNKYGVEEVVAAARRFALKTGRRVSFEYTLTDGENSTVAAARRLASLLGGFPCHVNLIRLNYVKERGVRPASEARIQSFLRTLESARVSATVRRSMGADIDGACGQLRRRVLEDNQ